MIQDIYWKQQENHFITTNQTSFWSFTTFLTRQSPHCQNVSALLLLSLQPNFQKVWWPDTIQIEWDLFKLYKMQRNQIPIAGFSSSSGTKILLIIEPLTEIEDLLLTGLEVKMAAQSSQTLGWIKRSLYPSKFSPFLHWSHFSQACIIHDLCYITPGASQKDCDDNMLANTIAIHFENVENGWDLWFVENLFYFFISGVPFQTWQWMWASIT